MNNLLEEVENTGGGAVGVFEFGVRAEGELANSKLHDGKAETPNVRLDGILFSLDSLRRHVRRCAHKGVSDRVNKLARYTKVAQLDAAPRVDQDVRRFDVSVHDVMLGIKVSQTAKGGLGNLS